MGHISKLILVAGILQVLLSLAGGGLALIPFQNSGWLRTNTSVVGIYGSCPQLTNVTSNQTFSEFQTHCSSIFTTLNNDSIYQGT